MNSILDTSEDPLSEEDLAEVREYANLRIGLWKRRSIYSGTALLMSCASVAPFLYGHPLHAYWNSFGKYLILLSMGLLVVFVTCVAFLYNAWAALHDVLRG